MKRSTYYTYISSSQGVKLKTIRFFILFDKRECARRLNAGYTSIELTFRNIKYQTGGTIGALEEEQARKLQATLEGCNPKLCPPTHLLADGCEV